MHFFLSVCDQICDGRSTCVCLKVSSTLHRDADANLCFMTLFVMSNITYSGRILRTYCLSG